MTFFDGLLAGGVLMGLVCLFIHFQNEDKKHSAYQELITFWQEKYYAAQQQTQDPADWWKWN